MLTSSLKIAIFGEKIAIFVKWLVSSEKSTLSAKTSQTLSSHLSTAEKVFEQSKKNFDLKTGQANGYPYLKKSVASFNNTMHGDPSLRWFIPRVVHHREVHH